MMEIMTFGPDPQPRTRSDQGSDQGPHFRLRRRELLGPDVIAVLLVAEELAAVALGDLLDEELLAALRTGLEHGTVPEHEIAVGIVGAAEEHFAALGLAFDDV